MLKRDLKKLQRLRETVRGWLASGEIKGDDTALQDARRAIERHMESFKILEREMKTKAFSTAGLSREETDPGTLAKLKCADWLNDVVSRLETQTEALEADLEALGPIPQTRGKGSSKSPKNAVAERATQLNSHITRHREYLARLERTLRLLENDQVTPEEVESAIKDSLEYYIESFAEDDFIEDDSMWDLIPGIDAVDEGIGKITAHKLPSSSGEKEASQGDGALLPKAKKPVQGSSTSSSASQQVPTGHVAKRDHAPPPPPPPPPSQSTVDVAAKDLEELQLTDKSPFAVVARKEFSPQNSLEIDILPEVNTPWEPKTMDMDLIESGVFNRPGKGDAEWPLQCGMDAKTVILSCPDRGWRPFHPAITPASYPTQVHPALENETVFKSFPQDTLFFAFYFHPGSRQQGLAAKALKSQGWRFHTGMKTWFARTGQPTNATATYEEGALAYWEPQLRVVDSTQSGMTNAGWKAGTTPPTFRFEYGMLENEDIIL